MDGAHPDQGGTGYQLINNTGTLTPETRKVYTFLTNAVPLQDGTSGSAVDLTNAVNAVHFGNRQHFEVPPRRQPQPAAALPR